jgi:hypothetical protein
MYDPDLGGQLLHVTMQEEQGFHSLWSEYRISTEKIAQWKQKIWQRNTELKASIYAAEHKYGKTEFKKKNPSPL